MQQKHIQSATIVIHKNKYKIDRMKYSFLILLSLNL